MPRFDIREYKTRLRDKSKAFRRSMNPSEKRERDQAIFRRLISTSYYKKAKLILTYVSTPIEVDTRHLMKRALADGKRLAVPRCVPGTRLMEFYEITGLHQLDKGTFGVLEPVPEKCTLLTDFSDSICVVPGLWFDNFGYRLGYGKGYYDRFLSSYGGWKIGICYRECIKYSLRHGKYDVSSDMVINQKYIRYLTPKDSK